jgi:F-type H+-transporting ATPase subunit c
MNIINNNKENNKMLRIIAIVLGMLTVATSMAAEGGLLGAGIGAGIVVVGAGLGIGLLAFAAANATARQPEAAADIRATVNLPLFLLEGVAIIALVVCILAVVL